MKASVRGLAWLVSGLASVGAAAGFGAPIAAAALPSVTVSVVTVPMTGASHTGITVTAGCPAGETLVGGGSYLRNAANPATVPTAGLVLGGQAPSTGAAPVDNGVIGGTTDPSHWFTNSNFTGVAEPGDQASTYALCATPGPAHTVVATATANVPANSNQQTSPPGLATATCPTGDTLIGGGAVTTTPNQVNDGVTVGNAGNLKPLGSYPSNAAGLAATNGTTGATSWSGFGSAGISNAGGGQDLVTAYALCSTDPTTPPVAVARVDVAAPPATPPFTLTTASPSCPTGTQLIGGGYATDETVGATGGAPGTPGLQPQQGYHMRGSYPTLGTGIPPNSSIPAGTAPPTDVADGAVNPETWTSLVHLGGQSLPAGDFGVLHGFAMCATAPPAPPPTCVVTGLRLPGPSGRAEQDVTVSDPTGLASIANVAISNGHVFTGGSSGTQIDPGGATLSAHPTSLVLTAVKASAGTSTVWSFDATNTQGQTMHCA